MTSMPMEFYTTCRLTKFCLFVRLTIVILRHFYLFSVAFEKMLKRVPSQCKFHVRMRKYSSIWCEILTDRSEIFQTRSSSIFLEHRQETPNTVQIKIQWTGEIERTMAYFSFYLTLWRLESLHAYNENRLFMMRHGSRFYTIHLLFKKFS